MVLQHFRWLARAPKQGTRNAQPYYRHFSPAQSASSLCFSEILPFWLGMSSFPCLLHRVVPCWGHLVREEAGGDFWKALTSWPSVLWGIGILQAAGLNHNFYYSIKMKDADKPPQAQWRATRVVGNWSTLLPVPGASSFGAGGHWLWVGRSCTSFSFKRVLGYYWGRSCRGGCFFLCRLREVHMC